MQDFCRQYETNGLTATLHDIKIRSTSLLWCTDLSNEGYSRTVYENLCLYITKLYQLYQQQEPLLTVLNDACVAIMNLRNVSLSSVLSHYKEIVDYYLVEIVANTHTEVEYRAAHVLLVLLAFTALESSYKTDMLAVLAEESIRGLREKPSLLSEYHLLWSSLVTV